MQTAYEVQNHIEQIHVELGNKFLKEVFTDLVLPFGVLNKGKAGCGGTTVAIESPYNYIIFMPTIELINNKCLQYSEIQDKTYAVNGYEYEVSLLKVYGNIAEMEEEINQYIQQQQYYEHPIKILATYDSALKLSQIIGGDFYSQCSILVDEMHSLITEYDYRTAAIEQLLSVLVPHERVTYMSATPISPADGPVQLELLPRFEVIWPENTDTNIMLANTFRPTCSVVELICSMHEDVSAFELEDNGKVHYPEQFFFYINSVKQIRNVLDKLDVEILDEVNIVCADNDKNAQSLKKYRKLIGSTLNLKKFNLLTKKAFVGCDIYSPLGLSVIVTDVNIPTNYLDPCIDVLQIIGRIRDEENPYRDYILHLTNSNLVTQTSSKVKASSQIKINADEDINTENVRRFLSYRQTVHKKYNSIIDSYTQSGLSAKLVKHALVNRYCTFDKRDSIEIIHNILAEGGSESDFRPIQKMFWDQNPEIKRAIEIFGVEKLKSVSFKLEKIKKLVSEEDPDLKIKVATKLSKKIKVGDAYTRKELKKMIKEIYEEVGLSKNAKGSDIKEYYNVEPYTRSGPKNINCLRIVELKSN